MGETEFYIIFKNEYDMARDSAYGPLKGSFEFFSTCLQVISQNGTEHFPIQNIYCVQQRVDGRYDA